MNHSNSQSTDLCNLDVSFGDIVSQLLTIKIKIDDHLQAFTEDLQSIEAYYAPRAEFDRWKVTDSGKEWKAKRFKSQKECCAICRIKIQLKGSHIDHIRPIAKFPNLNLDISNMQILCPDCNVKKGDRLQ